MRTLISIESIKSSFLERFISFRFCHGVSINVCATIYSEEIELVVGTYIFGHNVQCRKHKKPNQLHKHYKTIQYHPLKQITLDLTPISLDNSSFSPTTTSILSLLQHFKLHSARNFHLLTTLQFITIIP